MAETDISGHEIYLTGPSRAVCLVLFPHIIAVGDKHAVVQRQGVDCDQRRLLVGEYVFTQLKSQSVHNIQIGGRFSYSHTPHPCVQIYVCHSLLIKKLPYLKTIEAS